jgi:hypothetical protein
MSWFNYAASFKILIFGLILGAGLPALFALGVRMNAEGSAAVATGGSGSVAKGNPALTAIGWVIFGLVAVAVVLGVLFVARDFIGHHFSLYILGAKQAK